MYFLCSSGHQTRAYNYSLDFGHALIVLEDHQVVQEALEEDWVDRTVQVEAMDLLALRAGRLLDFVIITWGWVRIWFWRYFWWFNFVI